MADAEDIQPLVCDNGTGMVKVILHILCSDYMCWFFSGDNFNFTLSQNLDMSWKLTKRKYHANTRKQRGTVGEVQFGNLYCIFGRNYTPDLLVLRCYA